MLDPLKKKSQFNQKKIIYLGPMIRIGPEIQCLPYAGFFSLVYLISDFFWYFLQFWTNHSSVLMVNIVWL